MNVLQKAIIAAAILLSLACGTCPPADDVCRAEQEYKQFKQSQPVVTPVSHIDIGGEK